MKKDKIAIAQKIDSANTYYLFRENGRELTFKIINNSITESRDLTTLERKFIAKKYLNNQHKLFDKLKGVSKEILDKLELKLQVLQNN
jgi:hypothetical protein